MSVLTGSVYEPVSFIVLCEFARKSTDQIFDLFIQLCNNRIHVLAII